MKNIKVSIITVSYNSVATIEKTIRSVFRQEYNNVEYIIIDGASTDGTQNILRQYDSRLTYWCSEPDNGLYYAMNKGIEKATGDIIGIINSDDWYEPGSIEAVVQCFLQHNCDIVYGDCKFFLDARHSYLGKGERKLDDIEKKMIFAHPTVFVKKEIYQKYGKFDCKYRMSADYDLLLRFFNNGCKFQYLEQIIANFSMGGLTSVKPMHGIYENEAILIANGSSKTKIKAERYKIILADYKQSMHNMNINRFIEKRIYQLKDEYILNDIIQDLFINRRCVIFGAGLLGVSLHYWLEQKCNDNLHFLECFFDNSNEKTGRELYGVLVKQPKPNDNKGELVKIVIAVSKYKQEIREQLLSLGYKEGTDFITMEEFKKLIYQRYCEKRNNLIYKLKLV